VLLTLMASLSQTFRAADMAESVAPPAGDGGERMSQFIALLDEGSSASAAVVPTPLKSSSTTACGGSRSSYAASFQVVLRGILQHMIGCSQYSHVQICSLKLKLKMAP